MAWILTQNGHHQLMAWLTYKVAPTKNTMYLLQNISNFCDIYCSGKWLLSRFQLFYHQQNDIILTSPYLTR